MKTAKAAGTVANSHDCYRRSDCFFQLNAGVAQCIDGQGHRGKNLKTILWHFNHLQLVSIMIFRCMHLMSVGVFDGVTPVLMKRMLVCQVRGGVGINAAEGGKVINGIRQVFFRQSSLKKTCLRWLKR